MTKTLPTVRSRAGRRWATLMTTAALLAGGLVTLGLPAQSASALAIDCSYTPGLSVFIGSGRDGYTCMGGGSRTPDKVYGSGSLPGQVVAAGSTIGSVCRASAPAVPDSFYGWGDITATYSTVGDYTRPDGSRWHATQTEYFRDGRTVAYRYLHTSPGKPFEMVFKDYTLDSRWGGVWLMWTFNCQTDGDWVQAPLALDTPRYLDASVPAGGGTPLPRVQTIPTMAPVPFHPGTYFLRIDVVNRAAVASSTPVFLSLNLTDYRIKELVSGPRDMSCPSALPDTENCIMAPISGGDTQTMTFVVEKKPTAGTAAPLSVEAAFDGYHKVGSLTRPGMEWSWSVVHPDA